MTLDSSGLNLENKFHIFDHNSTSLLCLKKKFSWFKNLYFVGITNRPRVEISFRMAEGKPREGIFFLNYVVYHEEEKKNNVYLHCIQQPRAESNYIEIEKIRRTLQRNTVEISQSVLIITVKSRSPIIYQIFHNYHQISKILVKNLKLSIFSCVILKLVKNFPSEIANNNVKLKLHDQLYLSYCELAKVFAEVFKGED